MHTLPIDIDRRNTFELKLIQLQMLIPRQAQIPIQVPCLVLRAPKLQSFSSCMGALNQAMILGFGSFG